MEHPVVSHVMGKFSGHDGGWLKEAGEEGVGWLADKMQCNEFVGQCQKAIGLRPILQYGMQCEKPRDSLQFANFITK